MAIEALPGLPGNLLGRSRAAGGAPDALLGLEHEYALAQRGAPLDFRDLIHRLPVDGLRLDPGDAHAYRLRSGMVLTADGAEAEIATPPIAVQPGFGPEIQRWASHGLAYLRSVLPRGVEVTGYSTHISVSMPVADCLDAARLYATTFAPALALLMENPASSGIYVRPRPGRLELCGDYVAGDRLMAVAVFAVGSARACANALDGRVPISQLPPQLQLDLRPCKERFGFRVHRHAAGFDLYDQGRTGRLRTVANTEVTVQAHLDATWRVARAALGAAASSNDLEGIEAMVRGEWSLGVEEPPGALECDELAAGDEELPQSPFGRITRGWQRGSYDLHPVAATWDFTVFRASSGVGAALLCIPGDQLGSFVTAIDNGALDRPIMAALAGGPESLPVLATPEQTRLAGFYSAMPSAPSLLAPERLPTAGSEAKHARGGRPGKAGAARPWKVLIPRPAARAAPLPPPKPRPVTTPGRAAPAPATGHGLAWGIAAGAIVGAIVAAGGLFFATSGGDSDAPRSPTAIPGAADSTFTATSTPSPTDTATATAAPATGTTAAGALSTASPTVAAANTTPSPTATVTPEETQTLTATITPEETPTTRPTEGPRPTATPTERATPTSTATPTATAIDTPSPTIGPTEVVADEPAATPTTCTPVPGTTVCE
jgi:hypothetical protein